MAETMCLAVVHSRVVEYFRGPIIRSFL